MRKYSVIIVLAMAVSLSAQAQKKDIIKTGINLGPLPVVAYDADKGLQLGAILNIFDYGDGTPYPNYDSKWYFEASFFTKGSSLFQVMYDNKKLIPGVRWSSAVSAAFDRAMDFYGFNGYRSFYDQQAVADGKAGVNFIYTPFYRFSRKQILFKSDFIGKITDNLSWEAGYHASFFDCGVIDYENINKGKEEGQKFPEPGQKGYVGTMYENYLNWGLIGADEAAGGFTSSLRAGLVYDTRDKEGAPTHGIWAEAHVTAAPKWLGTRNEFYRYSATWRHYLPIVRNDVLTFAYRLNYEGTFGNSAPYYVLPYITVMGENCDRDGMGGYRTVRGIMRDRVVGLDMATYTAELRWRFVRFQLWNQNMAFALSAFSDGTMVTRGRDMSFRGDLKYRESYNSYMEKALDERPHITFGAGLRFIMNENFIVAAEYGTPVSHFLAKDNPYYNQDGTGAFYVNIGYLF
mgnify:CR=1 FL=1